MFQLKSHSERDRSNRNGDLSAHTCKCSSDEKMLVGTLSDVEPGEQVQICCLNGESRLIRRLSEMGFIPGTAIEVLRRAPFLDPIEFEIRGYLVSLRKQEADCVRVKTSKASSSHSSIESVAIR